ncbi:MAG: hypothetical protein OCD76_22520 [Reichenbachiella sp.]
MSGNTIKIILLTTISLTITCLLSFDCHAQNYKINVKQSTFSIAATNYTGYKTSFTQPNKIVKKEWWRYIKTKASIFNYKTHYVLTIPARKNEIEIKLVSILINDTVANTTTLMIALIKDNLSEENIGNYNKKIEALLIDFKVDFYTDILQEKIDQQEKSITALGRALVKLEAQDTQEKELLQSRLASENKELDKLKEQLKGIK